MTQLKFKQEQLQHCADPSVDAILAAGPHVCDAAAWAIAEVGASIHLACFDLSPAVMDLINSGQAVLQLTNSKDCKVICLL